MEGLIPAGDLEHARENGEIELGKIEGLNKAVAYREKLHEVARNFGKGHTEEREANEHL